MGRLEESRYAAGLAHSRRMWCDFELRDGENRILVPKAVQPTWVVGVALPSSLQQGSEWWWGGGGGNAR